MRPVLVLLLAAACGAPPAPPLGALTTGADLLRLKRSGQDVPEVTLAGQPLQYLSPPFAPAVTPSPYDAFTIFPAFVEGRPASYLTTERWTQFPQVWIQPLYVPVKGYGRDGPVFFTEYGGIDPVFSVDAGSRFYSPYWQLIYFVTSQPTGVYKSARQILDAGLELHEGPGKFCALVPPGSLAAPPRQPLADDPAPLVGIPNGAAGFADGRRVYYLDLGLDRFTWNSDTAVVDETAQFVFARADGTLVDLPRVGGTGPRRAPRAQSAAARPRFGALWHQYSVALPPGAAAFVRTDALAAHYNGQGVATFTSAAIAARADAADYLLRVALNPADCARDLDLCRWLDSQAAIEGLVSDASIVDLQTLASCPLLFFNGQAVGP